MKTNTYSLLFVSISLVFLSFFSAKAQAVHPRIEAGLGLLKEGLPLFSIPSIGCLFRMTRKTLYRTIGRLLSMGSSKASGVGRNVDGEFGLSFLNVLDLHPFESSKKML